jgi:nucleoside-diphosphate-sugar epimerase
MTNEPTNEPTNTPTNLSASAPSPSPGDLPGDLHVVLGAGQIGSRLTRLLLARGHRVRLVQQRPRQPAAAAQPRLERVFGDLTDLTFAEAATAGARVVYDCLNPPYHEWPRLLLALGRGALHGATRAGAKLVALDCLYMFGRPTGPISETSPHAPCSKKGELRVALEQLRLDAHRRGELQVAIGRASDFFGPDLPFSCWNDRFFTRLYAGKPGECMGDPDQPHAYTFVDDIAQALATLGARDEGTGVWVLPTAPAETTRQLTARLGAALGLDARVERLPRWLLKTIGLFSPFMREVAEMTYQWELPFLVDDSRFVATFGQRATPLADAVAITAAWATPRFAPSRAA